MIIPTRFSLERRVYDFLVNNSEEHNSIDAIQAGLGSEVDAEDLDNALEALETRGEAHFDDEAASWVADGRRESPPARRTPSHRTPPPRHGGDSLEDRIWRYINTHRDVNTRGIYEYINAGDTESEITEGEIQDALGELENRNEISFNGDEAGWIINEPPPQSGRSLRVPPIEHTQPITAEAWGNMTPAQRHRLGTVTDSDGASPRTEPPNRRQAQGAETRREGRNAFVLAPGFRLSQEHEAQVRRTDAVTPPLTLTRNPPPGSEDGGREAFARRNGTPRGRIADFILRQMGISPTSTFSTDSLQDVLRSNELVANQHDQSRIPGTTDTYWKYKMRWALTDLKNRGLITRVSRGIYRITDAGQVRAETLQRITSIQIMAGLREWRSTVTSATAPSLEVLASALREHGATAIDTDVPIENAPASTRRDLELLATEAGYYVDRPAGSLTHWVLRINTASTPAFTEPSTQPTLVNPNAMGVNYISLSDSNPGGVHTGSEYRMDDNVLNEAELIEFIRTHGAANNIRTELGGSPSPSELGRAQRIARAIGYNLRASGYGGWGLVRTRRAASTAPALPETRRPTENERVSSISIEGTGDDDSTMSYGEAIRRLRELSRNPTPITSQVRLNVMGLERIGIRDTVSMVNGFGGTIVDADPSFEINTVEDIIGGARAHGARNIISTNLATVPSASERARIQHIAEAIGYTVAQHPWRLVRDRNQAIGGTVPAQSSLPAHFTRSATPRQLDAMVMETLASMASSMTSPQTTISVVTLARQIYDRNRDRFIADDRERGTGGVNYVGSTVVELRIRRAIRRMTTAGNLQTDRFGRIVITNRPITDRGRDVEFSIADKARTKVKFGDQEMKLPPGYKVKEGIGAGTFNTLTGFPLTAWTPQAGNLFYNPDRRRVYEFIRRISTSQPEYALGVQMPEGVAEVRDMTDGISGEGDFRKVRKSIPVERNGRPTAVAEMPAEAVPAPRLVAMPPTPMLNLPSANPPSQGGRNYTNNAEIPVGDEQETGERDGEIDVVEEEGE